MAGPPKEKLFRDSVHGYIAVPGDYCDKIIDTPLMQRLRHIEQTSMRVLYPSARHDRFAHSIGVFHLGKVAFDHLRSNSPEAFSPLGEDEVKGYKTTFLLACLLHDCAHAPFSHTLEHFYDRGERLEFELANLSSDGGFKEDYKHCSPKPHEKASAILILRQYQKAIADLGGDPLLAVRMVLGCVHRGASKSSQIVENALIQLLNGKAIDVDKLDYTLRDTWASGVNNASIDMYRLLASIRVVKGPHKWVLAFNKSALSVIQSVLDARNFLYLWVYSHHKVRYERYLMRVSIEKFASLVEPGNADKVLETIFSTDALVGPVKVGDRSFFLPTDGDIIYALKERIEEIPEAKEWLYREHTRRALWKSFAEYHAIFGSYDDEDRGVMWGEAGSALEKFRAERGIKETFELDLDVKPNLVKVNHNELFIVVGEEVLPYERTGLLVSPGSLESTFHDYGLIFAPLASLEYREEIIERLKALI